MNLNAGTIKNGVLGALALAGSLAAQVLGGWDTALQTLVIFMAVDYVTGILVAAVFHRSGKTERGTLDRRAGFKGLCNKGAMLLTVLVAARLDVLLGGTYARTAVILFFVGNEGLSILENLGLMGAPLPQVLLSALEALKKEADAQ